MEGTEDKTTTKGGNRNNQSRFNLRTVKMIGILIIYKHMWIASSSHEKSSDFVKFV